MGFLNKLFGGGGPGKEERGEDVGARLDALAQLHGQWSTEKLRRRVRDIFFAVQRSWIERDPAIEAPYMTQALNDRQKLRIDGLIRQHRVHQFENPLIEDLDFVSFEEEAGTVTTLLDISLVETILDADTRQVVAGRPNYKVRRQEYWTFTWQDDKWLLDDVEQPGEGARHMKAPLVGGDFAELSPEMVLREKYARGDITLEEFEKEMEQFLGKEDPTY